MSARKTHLPTVYIVYWPEKWLVKVGYSQQKRWWMFTNRGAELIAKFEYGDCTAAFALETIGHDFLLENATPAFASGLEAEPYLGRRGDGFKECFIVSWAQVDALLKHMLERELSICPAHAQKCYVRTNERTQLTHVSKTRTSHLTFRNAGGDD